MQGGLLALPCHLLVKVGEYLPGRAERFYWLEAVHLQEEASAVLTELHALFFLKEL